MAGRAAGGSFEQAIGKIYTDLASLQLLPDAAEHAQFISMMQQAIQKYLQSKQAEQAQRAQSLAQGQAGSGPQSPSPLGPAPGPAQFGPGGASGGGSPGPVNMPNPDELRRVLAGSSGMAG